MGLVVEVFLNECSFYILIVCRQSLTLLVDVYFSVGITTNQESLILQRNGTVGALIPEFTFEESSFLVIVVGQNSLGVVDFGLELVDVGDDFVDDDILVSIDVNLDEFWQYFIRPLFMRAELLGFVEFFHQAGHLQLDFFHTVITIVFLVLDFLFRHVVQNDDEVEG